MVCPGDVFCYVEHPSMPISRLPSRLALIVINYKNHGDTIECVESLFRHPTKNATVFLLDNASPNESASEIVKWLDRSRSLVPRQVMLDASQLSSWESADGSPEMDLVFVKMSENSGFAGGNNFVLKSALDRYDLFLLFNNDAACVNDAVNVMRSAMDADPGIGASTCRINYFGEPDRLQQMGGRLVWYGHFHRHGEPFLRSCLARDQHVVPVTFATGCVLMLRADLLRKHGLLSERIFFGEEDVDLCLRYQRLGIRLAAILDAVVLHKGGASQQAVSANFRDAAYATSMIGRAILLRTVYGRVRWLAWYHGFKGAMALNIMIRRGLGYRRTRKIMAVIDKYVAEHDQIDRETYFRIVSEFA